SIATEIFRASQLSDDVLVQIWDLADFGRDGKLSLEEFSIACHLLRHVKEGGQLTGPVDIFRYAPGSLAQQSLRARKKRVAEYEDHKQKLMLMKEKRKCQVDRETRRLNLAKSKVQVFQELYDLLVSLNTEIKTVEEIQQTIAKESDNIQKQEEIVDRVKKDHEKVRQETVKIILGEQKFNNDISIIKRDTDELNKRLLAVRTPATKDPDPFHQLYEQRKEKRQGSTIKDLDKIEIQVPFGFSPFDIDTLLHSKAMSWATGDNSAVQSPENVKNLLLNLHEFGEQFLATWSQELVVNTDKTQSDEDQYFQEIYDCTDVNWPDWDWSTNGLLGLTNDQVSQLKLKLTDLRETIQKLNSEAGRLVFPRTYIVFLIGISLKWTAVLMSLNMDLRNPEDYTARQRAREQEEKTEKSRVPRRSITDRLRAGIKGTGRTKDASKRYSYAGERSISLDTPEVARAAREYRLNRRSQILENNDFQKHETLREQIHEEKQPSSKDDSVPIPNISNPDKSTLTLKTSRRKDDLSLDLASIALGRRIQVEEIPVPVSSAWNKKSEQAKPDQRKNILSRSKSEDISLTTSASYELSLGNQPPSIPETPVRSSKTVRAPEPPAITASSTAFVNSTVTSEKTPDIFTSADPSSTDSTNQIISKNNVRVTKADRNSAADVESKNSKSSSDSFSVPQRPPRLKKRLGSSETSLELPSPESPPVLSSESAFQCLIDSLDSEPSKHENGQSLTIPEINHLEQIVTPKDDSNTNVDIIQICSDMNTAAQEETIITKFTSNVPNTHETLFLESDQPFEISIQEARQYPDSNPIKSTNLEVLDDSVDVTMSMVQNRVEAKLPSNAQLLDSDDEAPPPLPTSPPPLPSSAPPPLPLSTAEPPLIDASLLDQEETLIITEYTIPLTLTEQQRPKIKGHNSTTYSVKEHKLSDFDPLSTSTFSEKNNFSVPDASTIPAKTGDFFQSFDPLLNFTETTDVNANKRNQFTNNLINMNSLDDLDDYVRNGSETFSPGDSGHLSLSSTSESGGGNGRGSPGSSDRKSPARSADSPESGFHETIFSTSSSPLSSKPPSMYDQDVRAHNKKPNIAPQPQYSDSSAFVKQENGSQNLKKSPSGEWGTMSPKGKELVDKAKHFADMVQPKVVVRREKESSVEGDFSQDTLQSLELQRRAIISQSVVKRKANVVLSPSADLDNKLFQG
ncbi:microtubule-associated protein futsch, partial [Biomphalaria pfeifferi]